MPLFEVETTSHIMIACVADDKAARDFATTHYPSEEIMRVTHRPRDAWVISKTLLGIQSEGDPCRSPAIACRRPRGTSCMPCASTCNRRGRDLDGAAR